MKLSICFGKIDNSHQFIHQFTHYSQSSGKASTCTTPKDEEGGRANRFVMQAHSTEPEDLLDPSIVKSFFIRPVDKSDRGGLFDGPEDNFEMTLDPGRLPRRPLTEAGFHLQAP